MTKIINGHAAPLNNNAGTSRQFNLKYFNLGLFTIIMALGVFYLFNISALTAQGFILRDYKSKASALANEQTDQEEQVNVAQSYYSLNARAGSLHMVAVGDVDYLADSGKTLAKN
jgi:hypothetical protein